MLRDESRATMTPMPLDHTAPPADDARTAGVDRGSRADQHPRCAHLSAWGDLMSDFNALHNRAVWFDIPVRDLDRAAAFYTAVLAVKVAKVDAGGFEFCVLDHDQGNGGCLVKNDAQVSATAGVLLYMNADGRIRDAVRQVAALGGKVLQDTHAIGPHGFRAIVVDSEGNRLALHSTTDA
jgi:predicted enzyme related to lactoylglutathione lyase